MNFPKSKRGVEMLEYEGFIYNLHIEKNDFKHFRCKERKCHGKVVIKSESFEIVKKAEHNHEKRQNLINRRKALETIKELAKNTRSSAHEILNETTATLNVDTIEVLPCIKSIKNSIGIIRNKELPHFDNEFFDIPQFLQKKLLEHNFLGVTQVIAIKIVSLFFILNLLNIICRELKLFYLMARLKAVLLHFSSCLHYTDFYLGSLSR
jgi:hypothetical protein